MNESTISSKNIVYIKAHTPKKTTNNLEMLLPPLLLLFYASEYNILSVERSRLLDWRSRLFKLSTGCRWYSWNLAIPRDWSLEQFISCRCSNFKTVIRALNPISFSIKIHDTSSVVLSLLIRPVDASPNCHCIRICLGGLCSVKITTHDISLAAIQAAWWDFLLSDEIL